MKNYILLKLRKALMFSLPLLWLLPHMANGQSWYNTSWSYRKMITIDYTKVGSGTHASFPVVINRADADLQTKAQTDADDILFTLSDGTTKLDHEIESYTSGTGTLVAWVEIPSLSSSANTIIFMYYGNAAATAQQNITATWNATYQSVWHLNNAFLDATSNNYDATNTGTTNVSGKISNGRGFVRADGLDYITIPGLMGSPGTFTMSGWATLTSSDADGAEILSMGDCTVLRYDEASVNKTSGITYNGASTWSTTGSGINYAGTGWHYVVYTFDNTGNSQKLYVDGIQVGTSSTTASPVYTGKGTNTFIGKHGNGHADFDFDGTIDEVHVSNVSRSAGWVLTEYNNQNAPSTFYSVGNEAKMYYTIANGNWNASSTWSNSGHAGAASSTAPGNAAGDYVIVGNNNSVALNVNVTNQTELIINSTGTLNMGTNSISGAASFTLNSGGSLGIGSTAGITSSGATGNVQMTGMRTFNTGSNYIYNGTSPQVTGSGLPATVNNLTINNSAGVTLSANVTVNSDLTVTSGVFSVGAFSMTVTGITTVTSTLTITSATGSKSFGDLTINGTFNNTAANEPFAVNGNFQNNGTFNGGTGRVTFTGAASNTISGTAASTGFGGGITVNKGTSYTSILDVTAVITIVSGGLTLSNGTFKLSSASVITPFTVNILSAPFLIPATAGLWCNGGTINTTVSMLWTVGGLLRVSAGTLNQGFAVDDRLQPKTGASIIVEGGNMNCAARISNTPLVWSFTMTGGTLTIGTAGNTLPNLPVFHMDQLANSFSMSGGTMIIERSGGSAGENLGYHNLSTSGSGFTGGTLQIGDASTPAGTTIEILSSRPIYNLTVNGVNVTAQLDSFAVTTVTNNVTITAGTLDANNLDFAVGGNWTKAIASAYTPGTGTVTFNGSGTQSINGAATSQTFNHIIVAKTAGSLLNTGGGTITLTTNNFRETTGNFTAPATMNINAATASSFTLTAGTFTASATTNVSGNWINSGTFAAGTGRVTFSGTTAQTITGVTTFNNFTLNNSKAANALTLNNIITVNGVFTLTDGHLITTSSNILTLGATATVTLNGITQDSSFVKGPMIQTVATTSGITKTFPVGKGTIMHRADLTVTHSAATTTQYTGEYFPSSARALGYSLPGTLTKVSDISYWTISKGAGSAVAAASVKLYYFASDAVNDAAGLRVAKDNGAAAWTDIAGTGTAAPSGTITSTNNFTSFSKFALANAVSGNNVLPVELLFFTAQLNDSKVDLSWETASEINSDSFIVERSGEGFNFATVAGVDAAGYSNHLLRYSSTDEKPLSGLSYYRLRQTDYDGTETYSNIASVYAGLYTDQLSVYPNPVTGTTINIKLQFEAGNEMQAIIYNMDGQVILSKKVSADSDGTFTITPDGAEKLVSGVYLFSLFSVNRSYHEKLIVL